VSKNNMYSVKQLQSKFIRCSCGCHIIAIEKDPETKEAYMSFYGYGHKRSRGYDIKFVLRCIWNTITTGHPYTDAVCLDEKEVNKLVSALKGGCCGKRKNRQRRGGRRKI